MTTATATTVEALPARRATPAQEATPSHARAGLAFALGAYLAWGVIPTYFKLLAHVPPIVVLSHRIVWSVAFLALLLTVQRKWDEVRDAVGNPRTLAVLVCTTLLIAVNWFVFIWAVTNGRILQASLGYFINPLVNVLLGVAILRERLRAGQIGSIVLATAGVVVLTLTTGGVPWVALSLAFSFSFYGLLRKVIPVGAVAGLSVETAILFPLALAVATGVMPTLAPVLQTSHSPFSNGTTALLVMSGVVTAIPLLLFAAGARRLRFSTLGFLQYVSPTCQFLLAVLVYHEPFTREKLLSFGLIWAALAVYTLETVRHLHRSRAQARAEAEEESAPVCCPE